MRRNLTPFLILLTLLLTLGRSPVQAQAVIHIGPENADQFFSLGETLGRFNVLCHVRPQNGRVRAGLERTNKNGISVWRLLGRFRRQRIVRMLNAGRPEHRIVRVRNRFRPRPHNNACRDAHENSETLNAPIADSLTIPTIQATPVQITLSASDPKGLPLNFEVVSLPSNGTLSGSQASLVYTPSGYYTGTDSFSYVADNGTFQSDIATVTIPIGSNEEEFIGNPQSLKPYRQLLTPAERLHLLRRLAYGNPGYLAAGGSSMSLDDFLDERLLNQLWHALDTKSVLDKYRDIEATFTSPVSDNFIEIVDPQPAGQQSKLFLPSEDFSDPATQRQAIYRLMTVSARSHHNQQIKFYWSARWAGGHYLFRSRYLSSVEAMMSHLWLGHFGTSGIAIHDLVGYYMQLIDRESLGNFRTMLVGTSETGCGDDEGNLGGIICDALSSRFLDNHLNTKTSPNENFSRELMELYTMSPQDNISGMPNYTDIGDVEAVTAFMSGYKYSGGKLSFDPNRHDDSPQTAFTEVGNYYPGLAITNQAMEPREFVNFILDNHPAVPRFIAGKIFSMLVYPDPDDMLVEELGYKLKELDYDISKFLKFIGRSEAMFSKKARYRECVHEPFRPLAETINMLQLSMVSFQEPFGNSTHSLFNKMYLNLRDISDGPLGTAGEAVLFYPDVFSHDYCGRNPGVSGREEWLPGGKLVGRIRGIIDYLRVSRIRLGQDFSLLHIRDLVVENPYASTSIGSVEDINASDMIDFFSVVYNVNLGSDERDVIKKYLEEDSSGGGLYWDPLDDSLFESKTAGLIAIFGSLAQANIH